MSRLPPVDLQDLPPALRAKLEMVRGMMGFVPNSLAAMGHRPEILDTFLDMAAGVMGRPGDRLHEIKALCAHVSSNASGCRYCQAHTASTAARSGYEAKLAAAFSFETSDLFTPAERAALTVAARAGMVPNMVEDEDMARLRQHYDDGECAEIMAMISLFGFLNRWNDTLATPLEAEPLAVAPSLLKHAGWTPGKHGGQP
ncbi:hypothetical protein CSC94_20535 [Zhengella mangrovi]|uniref:Carboxymuconolactone decarboxylase-like domain-containing protein n=1 Tax=Zhengella mangrovi TaxID=1982044 RepID=A0A2G1QI22_9HYPH|nr:carboxymuconolactone decarboxylase family protein [Zhengella mangrovi]PHP65110.1 hypothetical protein CSC94_20535 [Zhengella mangrovi]